jgi:hypothetical protein
LRFGHTRRSVSRLPSERNKNASHARFLKPGFENKTERGGERREESRETRRRRTGRGERGEREKRRQQTAHLNGLNAARAYALCSFDRSYFLRTIAPRFYVGGAFPLSLFLLLLASAAKCIRMLSYSYSRVLYILQETETSIPKRIVISYQSKRAHKEGRASNDSDIIRKIKRPKSRSGKSSFE